MRNFLSLVKINLSSLFASNFFRNQKKVKTPFLIFMVLFFLAISFGYSYMLAKPLVEIGQINILIVIWTLITNILLIIMFISSSNNILYKSKDNNLLLSMPISKFSIVASKLISVISFGFLFELIILVPALIVYYIFAGITFVSVLSAIIGLIVMPLLPLCICTLLSCFFSFLGRRLKHKNIISTIFSIAFFLVFFYFYMQVDFADFSSLGNSSFASITTYIPSIKWFILSVTTSSIIPCLLSILIAIVCLSITIAFVGLTFFKMNNFSNNIAFSKQKVLYKNSSVFFAFVKKEFKKFFNSPSYVVNSCLGLFLILGFSIYAICNTSSIFTMMETMQMDKSNIFFIASFALSIMLTTCCTTSISLSYERKCFNTLKTLPVKHSTVLYSKIYLQVILEIPIIIISAIILTIGFGGNILQFLIMISLPIATAVLSASMGIIFNLLFPNMTTDNDTLLIKQSASSMLSIFIPMLIMIIIVSIYFGALIEIISLTTFFIIILSLFIVLCVLTNLYIVFKSKNKYDKLVA